MDKFVGILPEINLPETSVQVVLTSIPLFEVELARREGASTRDGVQAPYAVRMPQFKRGPVLGSLATKFFEEFFLIQ